MVDKYIKDGKVAVLVSPGYGAGWSTWGDAANREAKTFDPDIAKAVEKGDMELAGRIAKEKYPEDYSGGLDEAEVVWVEQGHAFRIDEYDGYESIEDAGTDVFRA